MTSACQKRVKYLRYERVPTDGPAMFLIIGVVMGAELLARPCDIRRHREYCGLHGGDPEYLLLTTAIQPS